MNAPRRAVVLTAEIQADTRRDLASALFNLATQLEAGEISGPVVVSGGYNSGYILHLQEDEGPTHDEFVERLRAFLQDKQNEQVAP